MKKTELLNFIETYQVTNLRAAVADAVKAGMGYPAIVMAYGAAGTGKTWTLRKLYVEFGGVYLRVFEGLTLAAFLQELCFELCKSRPHGISKCRRMILAALGEKPVPIFVDEAERLPVTCLEALRDFHDATGTPVIIAGEMGLPTLVAARDRLNDRIPEAYRIHFKSLELSDISMYAMQSADLSLTPEAVALVSRTTNGNFRRVHNAVQSLERAANAKGNNIIDAAFAKAVLCKEEAA